MQLNKFFQSDCEIRQPNIEKLLNAQNQQDKCLHHFLLLIALLDRLFQIRSAKRIQVRKILHYFKAFSYLV